MPKAERLPAYYHKWDFQQMYIDVLQAELDVLNQVKGPGTGHFKTAASVIQYRIRSLNGELGE